MPSLRLSLLGDFLLMTDGTPLTTLKVPRVQSLLAYLVLHRQVPQARSHLAFLFWPDSEEAQAHTNLRQLLHHLRRSTPSIDQLLSVFRQTLHWHPMSSVIFTLDVEEFEQALARAEYAEQTQDHREVRQALGHALALYHGDLFPGCYEEWIFPERDRLHQLFLQAAERLLAFLDAEREYQAAIPIAQQLLRHDPLHEATCCQLMRFHALCGNRAAALRLYHTYASLLERDLGTAPGEAIRQVYERLVQQDVPPGGKKMDLPSRRNPPLIGRQAQWRFLQTAWREATGGRPHLILLTGEAGIGKTRLAEEMTVWVSRQGIATASARCYAAEGNLPYAPVSSWLRSEALFAALPSLDPIYLTELLRLLPELAALRPDIPLPTEQTQGWQRQRFFEALARALLSLHQPLLLLLDDLQWCDGETLQWLHYFFRFAPQASVLVLAMVRIEEVPAGHPLVTSLREWQREDLLKELTLEPLHLSETRQLVARVAGQMLNEAQQDALHRETEGNPLFVIEMLRAALLPQSQQEPAPNLHRPLLASSPSPFPPAIRRVLVARLEQLTPETRELVKLAAVIGREFSFTLLTHASRESEENLLRALDELWQRRIVREQGVDAYDFSHGKLREQAYLFLSTPQRCFLHRRVAEALKAVYASNQDAVSTQIAAHYEQAGALDQAIPFYLQAGKRAERVYAHEEALVTLQRAATLVETYLATESGLSWEVITAIYEEQGNILEMIGKHREAEHIYQQARKALPAYALLTRARLCRKIAATRDYPPHLEAAHQAYLEAKYTLEQAEHQERQAWREEWLQSQLGHLQVFFLLEEWREMTTIIEQIQPLIEQSATAAQRATFFTQIALRDAVRDRYVVAAETLSACQKGLQAALSTDNPHVLGATHFVLGYCLFLSDQFEQAEKELQIALSLGEQVGDAELVARCRLHFLPLIWRRLGRIEEIRRVVGEVQARGERRYYALFSAQQAWLDWRDGKQEKVEEASSATTLFKQPQRPPYPFQWTGLWPQIAVAVQAKQIPLAVNAVRQLLSPSQQLPPEKLRVALEEIVQVEEGEQLHSLLNYAVQLAQEMGYL